MSERWKRGSNDGPCSVEGCEDRARAKGMCGKHRHRMRRYGNTGKPVADLPALTSVAKASGITYRQADHWSRTGYLSPIAYGGQESAERVGRLGTGHIRRVTPHEARVVRLMARLVHSGLSPELASRAARDVVYDGRTSVRLGDGILLFIVEGNQA